MSGLTLCKAYHDKVLALMEKRENGKQEKYRRDIFPQFLTPVLSSRNKLEEGERGVGPCN